MGQHHDNDQAKLFKTQLGQGATVQRSTEKGEGPAKANFLLREIGNAVNPLPDNLEYQGSAAVHIFYNRTLEQAFFVNQVRTLDNTNELLAQAATKDLIGTIMEFFGKKRPKMRSGF